MLEKSIDHLNLPKLSREIFLASWSFKTKKQYVLYIKQWITFCVEKEKDYNNPTVKSLILFLTSLFRKGLSYSAINIARSAISSFAEVKNGIRLGAHHLISKFMLGVRNLKPKVSKYSNIWDVDIVLKFLVELWPNNKLSLELLTKKFVMLFLLVTSQRIQALQVLKLSNLCWINQNLAVFVLTDKLKHVRKKELGFFELRSFEPEPKLCIVLCLKEYISRTKKLRGNVDQLLITIKGPFGPPHHDTIGRWVSNVFRDSGVDCVTFKPHSTRSATVSKYSQLNVTVDKILQKADWASESTFRKYYQKQILPKEDISGNILNNFLRAKKK